MMRVVILFLSISLFFSLSACTPEKDGISPKQQSALELSRTLFSHDDFDAAVGLIAQKSGFYMSDSEINTGKLADTGLSKSCLHNVQKQLKAQMQKSVSYTDTVQNMSEFYYENFSKTEMDKLTKFFNSSLGEQFSEQIEMLQSNNAQNFNPLTMMQNLSVFQKFMEIASSDLARKSLQLLPQQASHTFSYLQQTLLNEQNRETIKSVMSQALSQAMQQGGCEASHLGN